MSCRPFTRPLRGRLLAATVAGLLGLLGWPCSFTTRAADLPAPPEKPPPAAAPGDGNAPPALAVTLLDVLRVASLSNLDIAQAREVVRQAQIARYRARAYALPNLTFFTQYVHHEGRIQKTEGNIIDVNRDSLQVAAGPSLAFGLSDALFAPPIARRVLDATLAGQQRVTNDTLFAVADAYIGVLRARRRVAKGAEVLDFLTSPEQIELRGNAKGLLPLITAFVETGNALPTDKARVEVDVLRFQDEYVQALQELRLTTAELARLLHLDPLVILWPLEDYRVQVPIPGEAWFDLDLVDLVGQALNNRPELAENQALINAALARLRNAQWRPLMPNLVLNYYAGGFGGSPQFETLTTGTTTSTVFGHSGRITRFGNRSDFDAMLLWRLQNLGLGNLAEVREQRSLYEQANLRQLQIQDRVVTQVVQGQEQVRRNEERLRITRSALYDRDGKPAGPAFTSVRLNFLRIQRGGGQPLEVLDSIRRLSDLLDAYSQSLSELERAKFRLLIALGLPAQALLDPHLMLAPPVKTDTCVREVPSSPRLATESPP